MRILQASPVVYSANPAISNAIIRNNLNITTSTETINQQNHNQTLITQNNDYENLNGNSDNTVITNFISPTTASETFDNCSNNLTQDIYNNKNILKRNSTTNEHTGIQDNNCFIKNSQNQINVNNENYHENLYNNLNQLNNIKSNNKEDNNTDNFTPTTTDPVKGNFNRNLNFCDIGENINNGNDNDNCRQLLQENLNFLDTKQDKLNRRSSSYQSQEISKNLNIIHTDQFNNFNLEQTEEDFCYSDSEEIEDKDDNDVEFTDSPPLEDEMKNIENFNDINENFDSIDENLNTKLENINKISGNIRENEDITEPIQNITCEKEKNTELENSELLTDKIINSEVTETDLKDYNSIETNKNFELEKLHCPTSLLTAEETETNRDNIEIEIKDKGFISNNMVKETLSTSPISTDINNEGFLPNKRPRRQRCSSPAGCVLKLTNKNRNPDDCLMDDEGGYSTSSPSTFGSLNSSPDLSNNYPRGIINPNYPGFQHLAHTLSEHFVTHPNDPDDSDLSEFEIELSIDDEEKFENLNDNNNNNKSSSNSANYHSSNSNFNNKNSPNILNNNSISSEISDIMMSSISDELNYNLETSIRSLKEPREHKEILLPEIRVSFECHDLKNDKRFDLKDKSSSLSQSFEKTGITDISQTDATNSIEKPIKSEQIILKKKICTDDIDDDDISSSCDLETYLQKYETSADIRSAKMTKSLQIHNNSQDECDDEKNRNCPTPDILQKSNKNDFSHRQRSAKPIDSSILSTTLVGTSSSATSVSGSENRPDLLKNVCPQTDAILQKENQLKIKEKSENLKTNNNNDDTIDDNFADANNSTDDNVNDFVEQKQLRNQVPDNIPIDMTSNNDTNKDDISFGITPVDIVGDFGREVEREFGLLVTGYNTRLCRDPSPVFVEHEKKFMEKMTDAILSDAKEQITFSGTQLLNNSSIAANSFIARATLNQPITGSTSIPCDLVMQTSAINSIIQNKNVEQTPNKEIDKINMKMTQNSNNNEILQQPTKYLVKQVKQRIPPTPPPRRFLAQQLLQQKEHQLLKQQQQKLNSTLSTSTTTTTTLANNSNTQSLNVVMQQNDTVSINSDMTNTTNNNLTKKLNTKNSINSDISQPTTYNSELSTTDNIIVANSDHNNIVATVVPVLESTTNSINNCDNNKQNLPTAIVKPKYQKYSYDERQLPPIGLVGFCDRKANRTFWQNINDIDNDDDSYSDENKQITYVKHNKSRKKSAAILSIQNSNSSYGERVGEHTQKLTKKLSTNRNSSQNLSGRDQHRKHNHYSGQHRGDNNIPSSTASVGLNSNYVAIVTPRKKDKFESILMNSSELKKMNQIYENHNNNNIKNSVGTNNYNGGGGNIGKYSNNNGTAVSSVRMKSKRETSSTASASFDVYNIETALPVIDLDAIENHLKKAKEEEKKRRNDREEIRRRLAMGAEDDYFNKMVNADRPGRKPSLQSRLQNGMNLQICFMNDASSDTESPSSDSETCPKLSKSISTSSNNTTSASSSRYSSNASIVAHPYNARPLSVSVSSSNNNINNNSLTKRSLSQRPSTLSLGPPIPELNDDNESDFFTKQARLQIEARMALAQAKDMAHMQMEIERQKQKQSPITEVIRSSLEKVGIPFPPEKRRVSRQMCTDMNIAQLQIIVNELHTQIERLNEQLVQYLMERDELHMGQDSMLVDIEDLTRYLGAKEQTLMNEKTSKNSPTLNQITTNNSVVNNLMTTGNIGTPQMQSKFQRIASLVKK